MFSPRLLAALALLAAVAALPATEKSSIPRPVTTITDDDIADDSPWFTFPLFGNLFAPLWRLFPSFADIGPKIIADENKFQIIVNVKDYKKEDLKVKVKGDFIFVQGQHEAKHIDRDLFASQFFHTYTLPANSSSADVTATLSSDGFLVVDAPLSGADNRAKDEDRDVPIVESGVPFKSETPDRTEQPKDTTTVAPLVDNESDRKEPTTSSPQDTTDKENVIPHGNEVTP